MYEFLKSKFSDETIVFIEYVQDGTRFARKLPLGNITFVEDAPSPFCYFKTGDWAYQNGIKIVPISNIQSIFVPIPQTKRERESLECLE